MRGLRFILAGLVLAGCQAPDKDGVVTITSTASEPHVLTDQERVVSGYCGRRLFELRYRPGSFTNTPNGRVDVDPLVTVRSGPVTRRYDKTERFVAEMFSQHAPMYRFQVTCYPENAASDLELHAYGVSYDSDRPVFSRVLLVFSADGAVRDYDNRSIGYDEAREY